jgi:hypothetical protein
VGLVVYGIAAARTYFDDDEANKVLEREGGKRREALEAGRLDPGTLAEPIARLLGEGRRREARIRSAIERAELPYEEVSQEVDRFIRAMEEGARRAQLLYEALAESPPRPVEQRLAEVRGDLRAAELACSLGDVRQRLLAAVAGGYPRHPTVAHAVHEEEVVALQALVGLDPAVAHHEQVGLVQLEGER